jgi:hypothetical protein
MTSAGIMEAKAGPFGAAGSETQTGLSAKAFLLLSHAGFKSAFREKTKARPQPQAGAFPRCR